MSGQSSASTVSQRLAGLLARRPGPDDRRRAALHLLDWTGCAAAALPSPAASSMRKAAEPAVQNRDWQGLALYLGALGNVLEMDDVDKRGLLHPGPVVIPAALIAAGAAGASDEVMLDAIVRGYEATIRVGRAVGPGHYRYWHNTSTCGPFGAAAAASSILGLDAGQTAEALGLAGTQASGLWQARHESRSSAKQLHTARAAHAGLLAANLVNAGFVGLTTILEGEQGFFAAMAPGAEPAHVAVLRDGWAINDVSFKPWPACRHAHAAIDAALALHADGTKSDNVISGCIFAYADAATFCDNPAPRDPLSAKFSLQHSVASALVHGSPRLEHFDDVGLADHRVKQVRERLVVRVDPEIEARYPTRFGARLRVKLRGGGEVEFDAPDAFGDPENPMTAFDIQEKFRMLCDSAQISSRAQEEMLGCVDGPSPGASLRDAALGLLIGRSS
ncbi:MAG: MmgE/PrpD family protein [Alphaproteobacteria bacterium]|nr:MmgE/PrpD family protein [Alphaproteobacteria bacterium]